MIKQKLISYKIFGLHCCMVSYSSFLLFLTASSLMLETPYLFKTDSPMHYLYGPLSYFFIAYSLNSHRKWLIWDYLHFIPCLLNLIELSTTCFFTFNNKIENILIFMNGDYLNSQTGWIKVRHHIELKYILIMIYSCVNLYVLMPTMKNMKSNLFIKNKLLFSWMIVDTITKFAVVLIMLFYLYISSNSLLFYSPSSLFYGLEMIVSVIFLMLNPKLLLGIQWIKITGKLNITVDKESKKEKQSIYLFAQLTNYMQINEPYKNKVSIDEIAEELKISSTKLAQIITKNTNMSFPDFINTYRLTHIDNMVFHNKHLIYSFEHISYEAGFSSKNAFYLAFKKLRKTTPKKYYEDCKPTTIT